MVKSKEKIKVKWKEKTKKNKKEKKRYRRNKKIFQNNSTNINLHSKSIFNVKLSPNDTIYFFSDGAYIFYIIGVPVQKCTGAM